jgi:hypothetical protein
MIWHLQTFQLNMSRVFYEHFYTNCKNNDMIIWGEVVLMKVKLMQSSDGVSCPCLEIKVILRGQTSAVKKKHFVWPITLPNVTTRRKCVVWSNDVSCARPKSLAPRSISHFEVKGYHFKWFLLPDKSLQSQLLCFSNE